MYQNCTVLRYINCYYEISQAHLLQKLIAYAVWQDLLLWSIIEYRNCRQMLIHKMNSLVDHVMLQYMQKYNELGEKTLFCNTIQYLVYMQAYHFISHCVVHAQNELTLCFCIVIFHLYSASSRKLLKGAHCAAWSICC